MPTERRLMRFQITEEAIASMLRLNGKAFTVVASDCPEDAKFVRACYEPHTSSFWVVMESDAFFPVPECLQIPATPNAVKIQEVNDAD